MNQLIILEVIIFILIILAIFSNLYYDRSLFATIIEYYFKLVKTINQFIRNNNEVPYIKNNSSHEPYKVPKYKYKSKISKRVFMKNDIYTLSKTGHFDTVIIYLHGGAYVDEPLIFHWIFCDQLVTKLKAKIIVPIYPLAPAYCWEDTYKLLNNLYADILKKYPNKQIIFMGDSAGGGLALAFTEYLNNTKLDLPDKLVLISPWLDLSMTNKDIENYTMVDFILTKNKLIKEGMDWANNLDLKDYRVSPLYGDLSKLKNVLLFSGTREIFFPDIKLLHNKLNKCEVNSELVIGNNLNHAYPLYPIVDAKSAVEKIVKFIELER